MTESIGTARLDVVVNTDGVTTGINAAKRSTQEMAGAVEQSSKRQKAALEKSIATFGMSRQEVLRWSIAQRTSGKEAERLNAALDKQVSKLAAQTRAQSGVASGLSRMGAAAKSAALGWVSLLAASVGVGAAFASIKDSIDFADKLNDMNQRLGVSAEALSGWAYAAKQTGTDIDALGVGMKKLAKNMAEALDSKSQQAGLFKALGVDVTDAAGRLRKLEDVLPEVADGFKGIQNETLKVALATELLGKSGSDLIEFFNQGSAGLGEMQDRARELGIVLSQDTLSAADQFNDKIADLKAVSSALATQIAVELLPALTKLVGWLTETANEGTKSGGVIRWIGEQADAAASDIQSLRDSFQEFEDIFAALTDGARNYYEVLRAITTLDFDYDFASSAMARHAEAGARLREAASRDLRQQPTANVSIPGVQFSIPGLTPQRSTFSAVPLQGVGTAPASRESAINRVLSGSGSKSAPKAKKEGKSDAEKEAERLQKAYESLAAQQREQIALFGKEGEAAKVRYDIENGELKGVSAQRAQELIANAERLDQMRAEAEVQKELDRTNKERADRTQDVLDDIKAETELLGKSVEQQDTYNKLKYAGVDANSAFGQSIIEANHALHEQAKATARQTELMDTFRDEASSAIADVVNGTKSLKDAFTDMFDNIAQRITQMIAERWIEKLFGETGSTNTGSAGGWVSAIASLFANANGNAFNNGNVMAFANGGVFDKPTMFGMGGGRLGVMGEAGPEAILPLHRGPDGKLGVRMEAANDSPRGIGQVTQNIYVQGQVDQRTRYQLRTDAARNQNRALARN